MHKQSYTHMYALTCVGRDLSSYEALKAQGSDLISRDREDT